MGKRRFTHDALLVFAGPLVWAVHFVGIYSFVGILCARPNTSFSWLGQGLVTWGVLGAGLVAIALIAACLLIEPRTTVPDNRSFVRWLSISLALLAVVAIIWETSSVFLIPSCT